METKFATPNRTPDDKIILEAAFINKVDDLKFFLNTVPNFVVVLDKNRQIVFANDLFNQFLGIENAQPLIGRRPGEAVNCIHSDDETGGCGTSEACRECGAVRAILESQIKKVKSQQECRISLKNGDSLDLMVWATPYISTDGNYTIFSMSDISANKRRRALERIFFHDILNTAGSLKGYFEILEDSDEEEKIEFIKTSRELSENLIDEIQAQKQLLAIESGEYDIEPKAFRSTDLMIDVYNTFRHNSVADGKQLIISNAENVDLVSDEPLMRRVLVNLVKNALEASESGDRVEMLCNAREGEVEYVVKNPEVMPKSVKLQIFQRSFSTKGSGRGLGTYSIKLLTEKYLKGKVEFESEEGTGTIFRVRFPSNL
ncbi:MAG: GHKL domain-containing protein [Melioribacteraceae bacterium]|nr:GHKL domain-containing protein [Melioribacteraceae bacterium]MCF8264143.1 GHKL domain-containing protein [Melioribacteraceae bacterium]MCF8430767.1 GHKL domain-containing protein [Melioribacteraceae bacterium]